MRFLGHLASTLAIAAFVRCAPSGARAQDKAFDSCRDVSVNGAVVSATCKDIYGGDIRTSIYLGDCFTNDNGDFRVRLLPIYRTIQCFFLYNAYNS
jgi:hypothetical protein